MKYKLLLMGENMTAISDFFYIAEEDFEMQSCSCRITDIKSHLRYFQPNAIVYCMHHEDDSAIKRMAVIRSELNKASLPFFVIGTEAEINACKSIQASLVSLALIKPLNISAIKEIIVGHLLKIQKAEEEKQRELDRIEEEKKQNEKQQNEKQQDEKKRILVVDDDVRMVRVIKRFLEEKYQIASAINGTVALRYLETKQVDLVLLDYEMPEMSGPEVLEKMREDDKMAKIPVVFLTGNTDKDKITKALLLKPQGYILKPVEREGLEQKVKGILGD